MLRWTLALLIGLSLSAASPAGAISVEFGTPVTSNSWSVLIPSLQTPSFAFDTMESFIVPGSDTGGGPWKGDGTENISLAGWSGSLVNLQYSLASGPLTQALSFKWHFEGELPHAVTWDVLFWQADELQGGVSLTMDNGGFVIDGKGAGDNLAFLYSPDGSLYDRTDPSSASLIPEPHSATLFGLGALIFAGALRRPFGSR